MKSCNLDCDQSGLFLQVILTVLNFSRNFCWKNDVLKRSLQTESLQNDVNMTVCIIVYVCSCRVNRVSCNLYKLQHSLLSGFLFSFHFQLKKF